MPDLDDEPYTKIMHLMALTEHYKDSLQLFSTANLNNKKILVAVKTEVKLCSDKDLRGLLHNVP